jgi:hypothetical protein
MDSERPRKGPSSPAWAWLSESLVLVALKTGLILLTRHRNFPEKGYGPRFWTNRPSLRSRREFPAR